MLAVAFATAADLRIERFLSVELIEQMTRLLVIHCGEIFKKQ